MQTCWPNGAIWLVQATSTAEGIEGKVTGLVAACKLKKTLQLRKLCTTPGAVDKVA